MANGTDAGGFRGRRSRGVTTGPTRAAAVQAWGNSIAAEVRRGQCVLQHPQSAPPPQGLPYERDGQKQGPHNFGGTRGLVLRTIAASKGYDDTRFATEKTARDYNAMHGDDVRGGIVKGRKADLAIPVPGQKDADQPRMMNLRVKLTEDGPNYDANGNQVEGTKGEYRREANGEIVERLVAVEGQRRGQGTVDYFNVDDLRIPSREPRAQPPQDRRDYLLGDVMAQARRPTWGAPADSVDPSHQPLQVREVKDMPGRAELGLEKDVDLGDGRTAPEGYVLRAGPADSFPSKEHHVGALVHEVNRFHMCRDGNADAIAVAKAAPGEREKMPEFARSELVASAATMERMTEVGYTWHPPQYSIENRRQMREAQAEQLEKPAGLDEVGAQASRTHRLSAGRAPTLYEQQQRNQDRAMGPEQTRRSLAAAAGQRPQAGVDGSERTEPAPAERRPAAPVGDVQDREPRQPEPAERAAADLYDNGRKNVTDRTIQALASRGGEVPTKEELQAKLDELNAAEPPRPVASQLREGKSFADVVAAARGQDASDRGAEQPAEVGGGAWDKVKSAVGLGDPPPNPATPPSPAAGAAEAAQRRGPARAQPQK